MIQDFKEWPVRVSVSATTTCPSSSCGTKSAPSTLTGSHPSVPFQNPSVPESSCPAYPPNSNRVGESATGSGEAKAERIEETASTVAQNKNTNAYRCE